MKKVLLMLLAVCVFAVSVAASGWVSLSLMPDAHVPSVYLDGGYFVKLTSIGLSVDWGLGMWTYLNDIPTGYNASFYVIDIRPGISADLSSGWTLALDSQFEYRTNLPNNIVITPRIMLKYEW